MTIGVMEECSKRYIVKDMVYGMWPEEYDDYDARYDE